MSYAASWSGGKDSCFALYNAIEKGYKISHFPQHHWPDSIELNILQQKSVFSKNTLNPVAFCNE